MRVVLSVVHSVRLEIPQIEEQRASKIGGGVGRDRRSGSHGHRYCRTIQDTCGRRIETGKVERFLPIVRDENFVQVFSTLLTEIFVRAGLCAYDSNTRTMLPDLADVALNKEAGSLIS
jgi:hypothetical protein